MKNKSERLEARRTLDSTFLLKDGREYVKKNTGGLKDLRERHSQTTTSKGNWDLILQPVEIEFCQPPDLKSGFFLEPPDEDANQPTS